MIPVTRFNRNMKAPSIRTNLTAFHEPPEEPKRIRRKIKKPSTAKHNRLRTIKTIVDDRPHFCRGNGSTCLIAPSIPSIIPGSTAGTIPPPRHSYCRPVSLFCMMIGVPSLSDAVKAPLSEKRGLKSMLSIRKDAKVSLTPPCRPISVVWTLAAMGICRP